MKSTWTVSPGPAVASALQSRSVAIASSRAAISAGEPSRTAAQPPSSWTSSEQPTPSSAAMSGPCAAPRTWREIASQSSRSSAELPGRERRPGGDRVAVHDPGERHARAKLEARERVAPHRARVRRGQDDRAAAALGVAQRGVEQPVADAAALEPGPHAEQAQAPDALAHERERDADDLAVVLRDPRAVRVGALQVRDPEATAFGAHDVVGGLGELGRDLLVQRGPGRLVGGMDVVGGHGPDQHRR